MTKQKWYKDNPETKKKYDRTRVTVVCSDGVRRRVSPTHPDYPGHNPNNVKLPLNPESIFPKLQIIPLRAQLVRSHN